MTLPPPPPLQRGSFAVIDTETTGLDPTADAVVSVAVVPIDDGAVCTGQARELLVNPGRLIPPESTAVHGLRDADVASEPDLTTALAELAPLLAGRVIVGHNLDFDLAFLATGGFDAAATLDTLAISRLLWPRPGVRHTLDHLARRVGVVPHDRHHALGDAMATAHAFVACLPMLAERGLDSPASVAAAYSAQRVRRTRVRRSRCRARLLCARFSRSSLRHSSPRRRRPPQNQPRR